MNRFERFGPEHVATLFVVGVLGFSLSALARRSMRGRGRVSVAIRLGLALFLAAGTVVALLGSLPIRRIDWIEVLPLNLCDMAVVLAIVALLARQQPVYEMLYFWAFTGTVIAAVTPDVDVGFPDARCVSFFGLHGGVVVSAAVLTWGLGMRPRARANVRAFLWTQAYAAVAVAVDLAWRRNYLYLCRKPSEPSILDWMGPWPWYILAADALAFGLFYLLMLPWRASAGEGRPAGSAFP